MRHRVYIIGPYSKGDTAVHVHRAVMVANKLADMGFAPYVPHLTHFWHTMTPRPYQFWLELDQEFISCCHAAFRIPGESSGGDAEEAEFNRLGIPVFTDFESLNSYLPAGQTRSLPTGDERYEVTSRCPYEHPGHLVGWETHIDW